MAKWYSQNSGIQQARNKANKKKVRDWFQAWKKTLQCSRCPEKDFVCLDFHHREGESKEEAVSNMVLLGYSPESILAEASKCDVLCANCHRKVHAEEKGLSMEFVRTYAVPGIFPAAHAEDAAIATPAIEPAPADEARLIT